MGDPRVLPDPQNLDTVQRPHLVVMSPFYLDQTEVTVAAFRASGLAKMDDPVPYLRDPISFDPSEGTDSQYFWCTFSEAPGAGPPPDSEALPVNCVKAETARAFCQARGDGSDLPTEAQFEYAAGGVAGFPYVWGTDDPTCADAVFGRAGLGAVVEFYGTCRAPQDTGGPLAPRSGKRDRLDLEGGTVYDLAGNLPSGPSTGGTDRTSPAGHFTSRTTRGAPPGLAQMICIPRVAARGRRRGLRCARASASRSDRSRSPNTPPASASAARVPGVKGLSLRPVVCPPRTRGRSAHRDPVRPSPCDRAPGPGTLCRVA
jgi:hypothetical protein